MATNKTLNLGGQLISLDTPKLMGILNVTPDSFYDGGKHRESKQMLEQVDKMISEGATFIDVGGYSSRPGAEDISVDEEINRAIPAIDAIIDHFPNAFISIDTFRAEVARQALESGAVMVNDISGGTLDANMPSVVAQYKVPYIMMHMKGTPQTMRQESAYVDLLKEVTDYFHQKIDVFQKAGVKDIIVDPGIGFSKTIDQNFQLLRNLDYFHILGKPVLIGLSRKSLIWRTLKTDAENALNGTTVLNTIALLKGASILRIHDVKQAAEAIKLTNFVR